MSHGSTMNAATTHGMVSAPQPEAVEAGLDILKAGGNVVDAAIGAALVQTVVDPQMCGIAGFGSMHVHLAAEDIRRQAHTHPHRFSWHRAARDQARHVGKVDHRRMRRRIRIPPEG